jgi:hypothetical protein
VTTVRFAAAAAASLALSASIAGSAPVEPAWPVTVHHEVHLSRASAVVIGHAGIHTHHNYILFLVPGAAPRVMFNDDRHIRYRHVAFTAHCRLPTDHAALPFSIPIFGTQPPGLDLYGAIDGQALCERGWGVDDISRLPAGLVRVMIPSRFVDWLVRQPPNLQRQYANPANYSLDGNWDEKG